MGIWQKGRQSDHSNTYYKLTLFVSKLFMCDAYILKYPRGSYIGWHKDSVPAGLTHKRLNIVIWTAKGGEFQTRSGDRVVTHTSRFHLFRPDIDEHRVTKIESGARYVLSIGWVRKARFT